MSTSQRPRPPGPPSRTAQRGQAPAPSRPAQPPATLLNELEIDELQACLDRVPAPLEPLDVSMLDGFLCGVLLQPERVPDATWLAHVTDADGRALPRGFDAGRLQALVLRRHRELNDAIAHRQWFDPWVFELGEPGEEEPAGDFDPGSRADAALRVLSAQDDDDEDQGGGGLDEGTAPPQVAAVYPWVAGFATAQEFFPGLMRLDASALTEPLALLYRHLDPDDLEDADALIEEIESLEPPADLTEAVEGLVRATLLLADVSRPVNAPSQAGRTPGRGAPRGAPRGALRRR